MARICTLPTASLLPGARVLPGRFNVVQMAIGVRKRAAAARLSTWSYQALDNAANRSVVSRPCRKRS